MFQHKYVVFYPGTENCPLRTGIPKFSLAACLPKPVGICNTRQPALEIRPVSIYNITACAKAIERGRQ